MATLTAVLPSRTVIKTLPGMSISRCTRRLSGRGDRPNSYRTRRLNPNRAVSDADIKAEQHSKNRSQMIIAGAFHHAGTFRRCQSLSCCQSTRSPTYLPSRCAVLPRESSNNVISAASPDSPAMERPSSRTRFASRNCPPRRYASPR